MENTKRGFEFVRLKDEETGKFLDEKKFEYAQLPEYQTRGSAGADFFAAQAVDIPPYDKTYNNKPFLVHTGIKAYMAEDEGLFLYNRSSNPGKKGLLLANSVGVVDSDYYNNPDNDGEIMFAFYNCRDEIVTINKGDRIGQGVFTKFLRPEEGLRVKDEDRVGGIGSTGK